MYPYFAQPHWHHMARRGPSRIIWFFIGAATSAWWLKHKDIRCASDRVAGHCFRAPIQSPQRQNEQQTPERSSESGYAASEPLHAARIGIPPEYVRGLGDKQWDEEKERIMALTRQAGDTMTELSETTLDTLLSTVGALKAKLAAHRAEREREQALLAQQLEERKRHPPRLV